MLCQNLDFRALAVAFLLLTSACSSPSGLYEDIAFTGADDTRLQGTLIRPNNAAVPLPAVVILHGAEPATRDRLIYRVTTEIFLDRGIAVFVYDKRGAGDSGGDHESRSYRQLADDAVAAIGLVKSHPDVDPGRVGLMAISESGWLAPEIAERSGVAYAINKVGSALSVRDTIAWEVYNEMLAAGVSKARAREQVEIYRRIWRYRMNPTDSERDALRSLLANWQDAPDSELPRALKDNVSAVYVEDLGYDPTPYLKRLQIPFLFLYGTEDVNIPTAQCVIRLGELSAAGATVSYQVFPGEGHELGGFSIVPPFYAYAHGFAAAVGDFAEKHSQAPTRQGGE